MSNMWMVRAGRGANSIDDFIEKNIVAVGWNELGEIDNNISRNELAERIKQAWPNMKKLQLAISVGQMYRYLNDIKIGDRVLSYDSGRRIYTVGTIESEPFYDPDGMPELPRCRKVKWEGKNERDILSVSTKNTLGAISTLFQLSDSATEEVEKKLSGQGALVTADEVLEDEAEEQQLDTVKEQSKEFIKDRISKLGPYELQDLVAGVLRAMGYKTSVSAPGPDRGVDILASPDGFGLIFGVRVKTLSIPINPGQIPVFANIVISWYLTQII